MVTDLYKTLGVGRGASKGDIKSAYRKRAKQFHPDKGGSTEKFGQIQRAHDVLLDDERRAKYDVTGDIDEKTPDNAYSNAINMIASAFAAVLQECANAGKSPLERDMVSAVRGHIKNTITEGNKQIRILKNMLETDKKMQGRFKGKKENIFEGIVSNRIMSLNINLKNANNVMENCNAALVLIEGCTFRSDQPERDELSIGNSRFSAMGF